MRCKRSGGGELRIKRRGGMVCNHERRCSSFELAVVLVYCLWFGFLFQAAALREMNPAAKNAMLAGMDTRQLAEVATRRYY